MIQDAEVATALDLIIAELRAERERRGWSLYWVGRKLGVTGVSVHHYEQGKVRIPIPRLHAWAAVLDFELVMELRPTGSRRRGKPVPKDKLDSLE